MQNRSKLEIRTKPKQVVQLNRPVLLGILALAVIVVGSVIVYAFTVAGRVQQAPEPKLTSAPRTQKAALVSDILKDIPTDYTEVEKIQGYSPMSARLKEFAHLQEQFSILQNEHAQLNQKLLELEGGGAKRSRTGPEDERAKTSSVVFPGLGSGSSSEDMLEKDKSGRGLLESLLNKKKEEPVVANQKQADLFQQEAENNQKYAVMKAAVDKDKPEEIYDLHSMVKPLSKYQVQAGTIIPASLITGIDSSLAGTIVAQVTRDIYDSTSGRYLLIPKGSKILGEYDSRNVAYGQRRIAMWYTRIIRPNGTSILLGKPIGVDALGQAGVEGSVDNHWARIIGAATISTLLSVGSAVWTNTGDNNNTNRRALGAGLSHGMSTVGQELTNKAIGIPPTITLKPGHLFNVTVKKDMVLTPYKTK